MEQILDCLSLDLPSRGEVVDLRAENRTRLQIAFTKSNNEQSNTFTYLSVRNLWR